MRIRRSSRDDGSIAPVACAALEAIPESCLYYAAWAHRDPRSLYAVSTRKVLEALGQVLLEARQDGQHFKVTGALPEDTQLLHHYRQLLYALREHLDDCYTILLGLTPPPDDRRQARNPAQFLKASRMPGLRRFEGVMDDYLVSYLAPIVNGLKHRAALLHPLILSDPGDRNTARFGFYVEESWEGGGTGPSWLVHKDGNSGFSFSRDLRVHFYFLFEISARLTEVLAAVCRTWHNLPLAARRYTDPSGRWQDIASSLVTLPYEPFPNELRWPTPAIDLVESPGHGQVLTLEYPTQRRHEWRVTELKVYTRAVPGVRGATFKLPYVGKPVRPRRP